MSLGPVVALRFQENHRSQAALSPRNRKPTALSFRSIMSLAVLLPRYIPVCCAYSRSGEYVGPIFLLSGLIAAKDVFGATLTTGRAILGLFKFYTSEEQSSRKALLGPANTQHREDSARKATAPRYIRPNLLRDYRLCRKGGFRCAGAIHTDDANQFH